MHPTAVCANLKSLQMTDSYDSYKLFGDSGWPKKKFDSSGYGSNAQQLRSLAISPAQNQT